MNKNPLLIAMDLEGVLVPEIWIAVAKATGIDTLRLTTRDISDYDELMRGRLDTLRENNLTLTDIQNVIATLSPMPGAHDFLDRLRARYQVVILSDTFYEFAGPLMQQLGYPTLFCNFMTVNDKGMITDYHLRKTDGKRHATAAFKTLNFTVLATGDSYNDTTMLSEAHCGILFRPSLNVKNEFPQFAVAENYDQMWKHIQHFDTNRTE